MERQLYDVLGVGRDADDASLKRAYRQKAKRTHPDAGGSEEEFQAVSDAWMILSDPISRKEYDETGRVDPPSATNDSAEGRALGVLAEALLGVVQGQGDPASVDLVDHLTRAFDKGIDDMERDLVPKKRALDRTRRLQGRFSRDGSREHRLAGVLEWQIRSMEIPIAASERKIEDVCLAREMIGEYEFEHDAPAHQPGFQVWSGSATTSASGY